MLDLSSPEVVRQRSKLESKTEQYEEAVLPTCKRLNAFVLMYGTRFNGVDDVSRRG